MISSFFNAPSSGICFNFSSLLCLVPCRRRRADQGLNEGKQKPFKIRQFDGKIN